MTRHLQPEQKSCILFVLATILTFFSITLLQFLDAPWFFVVLILMHGGIALFIVSKRLFKKHGFEVKRFFNIQYLMLLPYIFVMLYGFVGKAGVVPYFEPEKEMVTLIYSALCVLLTLWNYHRMQRQIKIDLPTLASTVRRNTVDSDVA